MTEIARSETFFFPDCLVVAIGIGYFPPQFGQLIVTAVTTAGIGQLTGGVFGGGVGDGLVHRQIIRSPANLYRHSTHAGPLALQWSSIGAGQAIQLFAPNLVGGSPV